MFRSFDVYRAQLKSHNFSSGGNFDNGREDRSSLIFEYVQEYYAGLVGRKVVAYAD